MNESLQMQRQMPVCIAGMHRSGTSMVTRLLNLCGLYLGRDNELLESAPDNPEGYWENTRFMILNDEILAELGGAWDFPPLFSEGWELKPEFIPLKEKAGKLLEEFKGHKPWGWKDPRSSLTIPFWETLISGMKVVVCLRNPLEVAKSLHKRGYSSNAFAFNLWLVYNQRLLAATRSEQRIITHYNAYFVNPQAELKRVLDFLDLSVANEKIEQACEAVSVSLRHNRLTEQDLRNAGASPEVSSLYESMYEEAGPFCRQEDELKPYPGIETAIKDYERKLQLVSNPVEKSHILVEVGELYFNLGLSENAKHFFERAIFLDPGNSYAHNNLGVLSFQFGDCGIAKKYFSKSLELNPNNNEAKKNLAKLFEIIKVPSPQA